MKDIDVGTHCYVGINARGCGVVIVSDMPGHEKATGKDVAEMIKDGMKVERATTEDAHKLMCWKRPCLKHPRIEPEQPSLLLEATS